MPSSPPDEGFRRIEALYAEGLAALEADDLAGVQARVSEASRELRHLRPDRDAPSAARDAAVAALQRLVEAAGAQRDRAAELLSHQRRSRVALQGYGNRLPAAGTRVERDA
ncbi:MAG: hypothetical protein AAF628_02800 [Planctomycetota bacterium]